MLRVKTLVSVRGFTQIYGGFIKMNHKFVYDDLLHE